MTQKLSLFPEHTAAHEQLVDFSTRNPEAFRLQAQAAYAKLTPHDRAVTRMLETDNSTAYEILCQWQTQLRPMLDELTQHSTRAAFHKSIAKYLLADTKLATRKINELITQRRHELMSHFIESAYPLALGTKDKQAKKRAGAYALFSEATSQTSALFGRYTQYLLHQHVAEMQLITVADPHAPWFRRRHASKKVAGERKKLTQHEQHRLKTIEAELTTLYAHYSGLLGEVVEKDWDLIVVIGLRNQYEKRLRALADNDAKSPLKRLEIFEKTTKDFRDQQVEQLAALDPSQNSLAVARQCAETIDNLLLQIFDLTNVEKNQLLVLAKQARELQSERDAIHQYRSDRQRLLQNSFA